MASTENVTAIINLRTLFVDILSNSEILHTSKLLKSLIQLLDALQSQPSSSLLTFANPLDSPLYSQTTKLRSEFYSLEHTYSHFESRLKAKDYILNNAATEVAFLRSELAQLTDRAAALPAAISSLSPSDASERLRDLSHTADQVTSQCIHAELKAAAKRQALHTRLWEMDLLAARAGRFPQMRDPTFSQCDVSQPPSPMASYAMTLEQTSKNGNGAYTASTTTSPSLSTLVPTAHRAGQVPPLSMEGRPRHGSGSSSASTSTGPFPVPPTIAVLASNGSAGSSTAYPAIPAKTKMSKSARSASSSSSASAPYVPGNGAGATGGGGKIIKPLQPIRLREGGVVEEAVQTPGRKGKGQVMNSTRSVSAMGISKRMKILKDHWTSMSVGEYAKIVAEDVSALMDACGYSVTKQMAKYILNQMSPKNGNMVTWESFYRVMIDQMGKLRPSK